MAKITYLFGAGASFESMPLQATMITRMELYRDYIFLNHRLFPDSSYSSYLDHLDELITNIHESTSIDQYAKTLHKSDNDFSKRKLRILKILLSDYLIFEQTRKQNVIFRSKELDYSSGGIPAPNKLYPNEIVAAVNNIIDKRYRTFLNDVYDHKSQSLIQGVNIISWNYDLQIETCFSRDYSTGIDMAQRLLNVYPSPHFDIAKDASKIIKMNGTAGVNFGETSSKGFENFISGIDDKLETVVPLLIKNFHENFSASYYRPTLTFAFENTEEALVARKEAKDILEATDILIIIGYSFPRLNFEIDNEILSNANPSRVILQAGSNANDIVERMARIDPSIGDGIQIKKDCSEFYVV